MYARNCCGCVAHIPTFPIALHPNIHGLAATCNNMKGVRGDSSAHEMNIFKDTFHELENTWCECSKSQEAIIHVPGIARHSQHNNWSIGKSGTGYNPSKRWVDGLLERSGSVRPHPPGNAAGGRSLKAMTPRAKPCIGRYSESGEVVDQRSRQPFDVCSNAPV